MTTFKQLRELVTFKGGGTPSKQVPEYWNGDIPWATVKDFTSTSLSETQDSISQEGLRNSSANLIPKGHVIIPTRMSLGKAAINTVDLAINQDLRALIPKIPLDTRFLLHAVLSLKDEIVKKGSGATVKGVTQDELYKLEIAFPPLDDQIRIAHLLGKVEGLIAQRKQHLQQLDDLLKSVFLEMFGPINPDHANWPLVEIRDLAAKHKGAMRTGPFGSNLLHSEFTPEGDVAVLGIDNAVQNRFFWGERRFISNKKYLELQSYRIFPGDVIVTIMGTIGRSAVIPDDILVAINTKHLAAITLNREVANPLFLSYSIHSSPFVLKQFASKNRGAIMNGLNLGIIKETKIKRPPIGLQNRFAEIHARVDQLKSRYQQSLTALEALYGALSQKAFKGELDLSRVPLPNTQPQEPQTAVPAAAPPTAIHLPDTELLLATLDDRTRLKELLPFWLDAYRAQLNGVVFSAPDFLDAAQERIAELHPDNDFELGIDAYELVKSWVFDRISSRELKQTRTIVSIGGKRKFGNEVLLRGRVPSLS